MHSLMEVFPTTRKESPRLPSRIFKVPEKITAFQLTGFLVTWCIFICCLLGNNCLSPEKVNVSGICYGGRHCRAGHYFL